uniref:Uncharacterized protein n=1 Tax=Nitratidesulfovibrio vulgaris (strain DSM 19637 / Miyazaki F) TaxID=883 RepID=B8DR22_NITV9
MLWWSAGQSDCAGRTSGTARHTTNRDNRDNRDIRDNRVNRDSRNREHP